MRRGGVVAGEQQRTEPERPQGRDRFRGGRLDRVGDGEQPASLAVARPRAPRSVPRPRRRAGRRPARSCTSTLQSARSAGRPTWTRWPSTTPSTPRPSRFVNDSTAGRGPASARAARAIAWAIGCSEASSSAPAIRRTSVRSWPSATTTSTSVIRPLVTVPVLSSTIVSTRRVDSSTSGPLMSSPSWAPRPVPTSSAVGVARPSAHGQAMMRTATAAVNANAGSSPAPSQNPSVATASPITTGTNTAETRSASRCTGALPLWASLTSRAICASAVSAPTRVARTTSRPPALTEAPATASPGCFSTGTDSPVSSDSSTALRPCSTIPSAATFSPGRTTKRSPAWSCSIGTRRSAPEGSSRATSLAPSSSRPVSAAPARRLARASKYRPARMNTVTALATSR